MVCLVVKGIQTNSLRRASQNRKGCQIMNDDNEENIIDALFTVLILGVIIAIVSFIASLISSDTKEDDKTVEMVDTYTIEFMEHDIRTVESGVFSTKKEVREYMDVIYSNDQTQETKSKTFPKENIVIGEKTQVINPRNADQYVYIELHLTKDDFIHYFYNKNE